MGTLLFLFIFAFAVDDTTRSGSVDSIQETDSLSQYHTDQYCGPVPSRAECRNPTANNPRCEPVRFSYDSSPSGVGALYSVYRGLGSERYSIDIPIAFNFRGISGDQPQLGSQWTQKVNQCLSEYRSVLTDGRRRFNIQITDSTPMDYDIYLAETLRLSRDFQNNVISEEHYRRELERLQNLRYTETNSNPVNIHSSYPRADSQNWGEDIDCSTISHEVMHLVGLCDHYQETTLTYEPNPIQLTNILELQLPNQTSFDCRPDYQGPNLMKNQSLFDFSRLQNDPSTLALFRRRVQEGPPARGERYALSQVRCFCPSSMDQSSCTSNLTAAENPGLRAMAIVNCPENGLEIDYSSYQNSGYTDTPNSYSILNRDSRSMTVVSPESDRQNIYNYARDILQAYDTRRGLDANQTETILHPLCMTNPQVRSYYQNAINAYRNRYSDQGCAR